MAKLVDLDDLTLIRETDKAFGVSNGDEDDDGKDVIIWLPKSQVEAHDDGTFTMPEWLANEKGLI